MNGKRIVQLKSHNGMLLALTESGAIYLVDIDNNFAQYHLISDGIPEGR